MITSLPLDGPWPPGSVGLPLAGIEVRVRQGDRHARGRPARSARSSSADRICSASTGESRRPRARLSRSGWFDTGDLGCRDASGFLTLVGRKNDLIITNGFNVYPQVVERVINECPGVRESVVLGVPDKKRGERVIAAVVRERRDADPAGNPDLSQRRLVDYQRPAEVVFVAKPCRAMPWGKS